MKKILIIFLIVLSLTLVSCRKKDKEKDKEPEAPTSTIVLNFTSMVEKLDVITLDSKDALNSAHYYYLGLNEEFKNDEKVKAAYQILQTKIDAYNTIYKAELEQANDQKLIIVFSDLMEEFGQPSDIILEDEVKINQAIEVYSGISETGKTQVSDAYTKLQALQARVEYLKGLEDQAYDKEIFIVKVNRAYQQLANMKIEDKETIDTLRNQYNNFSVAIKAENEIKAAYNKLVELETEMEIIAKEGPQIEAFLEKVYALPNYDNLRWNDATQRNQINECVTMYNSLSERQKSQISVDQAYQELMNIKTTFESLKEPYDVNVCGTLNFYNNNTPQATPIQALMSRYQYDLDTLKTNMKVYLNFYIEGGAKPGSPFYQWDITDKETVSFDEVKAILADLSTNQNFEMVKNGEHYCFAYRIVSLNEEYGNSYYSDFFSRMVINW